MWWARCNFLISFVLCHNWLNDINSLFSPLILFYYHRTLYFEPLWIEHQKQQFTRTHISWIIIWSTEGKFRKSERNLSWLLCIYSMQWYSSYWTFSVARLKQALSSLPTPSTSKLFCIENIIFISMGVERSIHAHRPRSHEQSKLSINLLYTGIASSWNAIQKRCMMKWKCSKTVSESVIQDK